MSSFQDRVRPELGRSAVTVFTAGERMNQVLIEQLDPVAWRAKPAGGVRTIAAIFTHMHNVRTKWVRLTAPGLKVPVQLNRARCTPEEARLGLAESAVRCAEMLVDVDGAGGVAMFRRDSWGKAWPVGLEMLCYMLTHEAHHRGQVCLLTHQLGYPLPTAVTERMWNWDRLWKECGFVSGPGR